MSKRWFGVTRWYCLAIVGWVGAVSAGLAQATTIPITNASFEADTIIVNDFVGVAAPSGWLPFNITGGAFVINNTVGNRFSGIAPNMDDLAKAVNLVALSGAGPAVIYQPLGVNVLPNTQYTFRVAVGFEATAVGILTNAGGKVELFANSGLGAPLISQTAGLNVIPVGGFLTLMGTYTSGPNNIADPNVGTQLLARLEASEIGLSVTTFDNVRLDAVVVPEPSTLALAGLGLIALVGCGLRRRWA